MNVQSRNLAILAAIAWVVSGIAYGGGAVRVAYAGLAVANVCGFIIGLTILRRMLDALSRTP